MLQNTAKESSFTAQDLVEGTYQTAGKPQVLHAAPVDLSAGLIPERFTSERWLGTVDPLWDRARAVKT